MSPRPSLAPFVVLVAGLSLIGLCLCHAGDHHARSGDALAVLWGGTDRAGRSCGRIRRRAIDREYQVVGLVRAETALKLLATLDDARPQPVLRSTWHRRVRDDGRPSDLGPAHPGRLGRRIGAGPSRG